jgi:hypothetical protein
MTSILRRLRHTAVPTDLAAEHRGEESAQGSEQEKRALDRATALMDEGQIVEAEEELGQALATIGDRPKLLQGLAEVNVFRDHFGAALLHSEKAVALSPSDVGVLADHAQLLMRMGLYRLAMDFLLGLTGETAQDPLIRASLGRIYEDVGWHALAVDAYGYRKGLPQRARSSARGNWWRTGGPIGLLRKRIRRIDEEARSTWRFFTENLPLLDRFDRPIGFPAIWVRAKLDGYLQVLARIVVWWELFVCGLGGIARGLL